MTTKKTNTQKTNTTTNTTTNTIINKEETVMKNTTTTQKADNQTLTKERMEMLNKLVLEQGMPLEEALQQVWAEAFAAGQAQAKVTRSTQPKKDNIAYIEGLMDLPEVRRVKKVAYAKKSKSKNNPEAVARYEKEIAAADAKLNELLALVNEAETPWLKAKELGETVEGQFNYFLLPYEDDLSKKVDAIAARKKATKAQVKAKLLAIKPEVPEEVPEELKQAMQTRIDNKDMRVVTVARKAAFVKKYSK